MSFIKKLIKKFLKLLNIEVHRSRHLRIHTIEELLNIKRIGFYPKTIIDVGIGRGTYDIYTTFPDSYYILIDPVKEFEPYMKRICSQYRGEYIVAAAGDRPGKTKIYATQNQEGSSLIPREGEAREVDQLTLDEICSRKKHEAPFLIKIDVEGGELNVLKGAKETLKNAEVVITETWFFNFNPQTPLFHELISYMQKEGFVVFNILGWNMTPKNKLLAHADIVFVKEAGMLRTPELYAWE